jgi:uncharacterized membrane protein YeaQ/YmgE (transglycosylase-associated protein family)
VKAMEWAIVGWIAIGIIFGWLAGLVVGGSGFGIIGDMIVGLIGGLIGGWIISFVTGYSRGFNHGGFVWSLIVAFIGAVVLLLIARLATGGTRRASVQ